MSEGFEITTPIKRSRCYEKNMDGFIGGDVFDGLWL